MNKLFIVKHSPVDDENYHKWDIIKKGYNYGELSDFAKDYQQTNGGVVIIDDGTPNPIDKYPPYDNK